MNELLRRSYGIAVRAQADATRSVDVIASSTALDGYGEIVAQDWDLRRYEANPVVLYGHNSWGMPIGHASNVRVEGDKLLATLNFVDARANPMAEQVWQGVLQGSLRAVSVGFRSKKGSMQNIDGKDVFVLAGNELMEISVVPIPANPEAVAQEARAFNDQLRALVARSAQETSPMSKMILTLASLIPVLALSASASEEDALAEVGRLKSLERDVLGTTGAKSGAEAVGVIQAGKAALARVGELEAQVAEQAKAAEKAERSGLIAKARADKKLAPTLLGWAESCELASLKAFLAAAPVIPQLAEVHDEAKAGSAALTHNGKSWAQMTPNEKHDLFHENRDLYVAMRDAANAA